MQTRVIFQVLKEQVELAYTLGLERLVFENWQWHLLVKAKLGLTN